MCFCTVQDFSLLKGKEYAYDKTTMLCVRVCHPSCVLSISTFGPIDVIPLKTTPAPCF